MWLHVLYAFCWLVNCLICGREVSEITTKAIRASNNSSAYRDLEATLEANPNEFIQQRLSTVGGFLNNAIEAISESNVETLGERRSTFLKDNRFGRHPIRKTTESHEDLMLTNRSEVNNGMVCVDQRESCSGLCNARNAVYYGMKCSCDIHCQIYRTCCEDFELFCPDLWLKAQQTYGNQIDLNIECLKSYSAGYLVIAGCPTDQQFQSDDKKKCDNSSLEQPISVGDLHFKNIYCLRCNGFNYSNGLLWGILVSLHAENFDNWYEGPGFLRCEHNGTFVKWNPHNLNIKQCSKTIIDNCPDNTSHYLASKCKSINSYVKVYVGNTRLFDIYSNNYCVQCNIGANTPCKVITPSDIKVNKQSHLSALVKWTFSPYLTSSGIFEGNSRTKWKKMNCTGSIQNWSSLQCSVTECWNKLEPVNGICPGSKSFFYVLFAITWNHIYLNDVNVTDQFVIVSTIEKTLKTYVQNVYLSNNIDVWATNNSVKVLVSLESLDTLSLKERRANIIPIIRFGLSKQRFQGEFSFCILWSDRFSASIQSSCRLYTNYTIPKINETNLASSVGELYTVSSYITLILICLMKTHLNL